MPKNRRKIINKSGKKDELKVNRQKRGYRQCQKEREKERKKET